MLTVFDLLWNSLAVSIYICIGARCREQFRAKCFLETLYQTRRSFGLYFADLYRSQNKPRTGYYVVNMSKLGLYLIDVISKGYKVDFYKWPFHPDTMAVRISLGRWHEERVVAKIDITYDELLLMIIKTMVEEIEEKIIKRSE